MSARASPNPIYLDGARIMVGAGKDNRTPREAVIDVVRKYVADRKDATRIEWFIDHVGRLPDDQRRELLRLGVLAAIDASQLQPEAATTDPADRPHAPAVRAATAKASWTPPASTGDGIAARLAIVAPGYDWTLPNGAELLEANVADIENAIEVHRQKAAHHVGHVKLLAEIKAKMLKVRASRVGDAFTRQQIEDLRTQHGVTSDA